MIELLKSLPADQWFIIFLIGVSIAWLVWYIRLEWFLFIKKKELKKHKTNGNYSIFI